MIEVTDAKDISKLSLFPNETEAILFPNSVSSNPNQC